MKLVISKIHLAGKFLYRILEILSKLATFLKKWDKLLSKKVTEYAHMVIIFYVFVFRIAVLEMSAI